jgi:hypothetical protein
MSDQLKDLNEAVGLLEAQAHELRLLANELIRIHQEREADREKPSGSEPPRGDALPHPVVSQRVPCRPADK